MAKISIDVDDLQPGEALVVMIKPPEYEEDYDDEPPPGEEHPGEQTSPHLMAIGGKR